MSPKHSNPLKQIKRANNPHNSFSQQQKKEVKIQSHFSQSQYEAVRSDIR